MREVPLVSSRSENSYLFTHPNHHAMYLNLAIHTMEFTWCDNIVFQFRLWLPGITAYFPLYLLASEPSTIQAQHQLSEPTWLQHGISHIHKTNLVHARSKGIWDLMLILLIFCLRLCAYNFWIGPSFFTVDKKLMVSLFSTPSVPNNSIFSLGCSK